VRVPVALEQRDRQVVTLCALELLSHLVVKQLDRDQTGARVPATTCGRGLELRDALVDDRRLARETVTVSSGGHAICIGRLRRSPRVSLLSGPGATLEAYDPPAPCCISGR
jgi:hypothetical protein